MIAPGELHAASDREARALQTRVSIRSGVPAVIGGVVLGLVVVLLVNILVGLLVVLAGVAGAAALSWRAFGLPDRVRPELVRALRGRPPGDEGAEARLTNLVAGLAVTLGVPAPDLVVVESGSANACVVGTEERASTLIVTTGLLEGTGRVELEGVVARELHALDTGRALLGTVAAAYGRAGEAARAEVGAADAVVELDMAAGRLTRYPPGLAGALEVVAATGSAVPRALPATRCLWLADPFPETAGGTHPDPAFRAAALREL